MTARYCCIGIQIICNDMAVTVLGCFTARIEEHGFKSQISGGECGHDCSLNAHDLIICVVIPNVFGEGFHLFSVGHGRSPARFFCRPNDIQRLFNIIGSMVDVDLDSHSANQFALVEQLDQEDSVRFSDTLNCRLEGKVQTAPVMSVNIRERIILTVRHLAVITMENSFLLFDQVTLLETAVGVVDLVSLVTVVDRYHDIVGINLALRHEHQGYAFICKSDFRRNLLQIEGDALDRNIPIGR